MDKFLIINFNEQMEFQVYKGCSHINIGDGSAFVFVESGFQKS